MNPSPPPEKRNPAAPASANGVDELTTLATGKLTAPGLTYKEVAYFYGRQYRTILRWAKAGKIKVIRTVAGPRVILEVSK